LIEQAAQGRCRFAHALIQMAAYQSMTVMTARGFTRLSLIGWSENVRTQLLRLPAPPAITCARRSNIVELVGLSTD
jgi:hypothetical protein